MENCLESLDISKNKFGVSGAKVLALKLTENKKLKSLNMFKNNISFDGAKAFGECLSINKCIEWLDIGHNRIRDKGLNALVNGIMQNKESKISFLSLRYNCISNEGFLKCINRLEENKSNKKIEIRNNYLNEQTVQKVKELVKDKELVVDLVDRYGSINEEQMERTIWIHPVTKFTAEQVKQFFEDNLCGVVLNVRYRKGREYPNRNKAENLFGFVEFADPKSVERAMILAREMKTLINGNQFRVFKCGTGTYLYFKKSAKQKKAELSITNLTKTQKQDVLTRRRE